MAQQTAPELEDSDSALLQRHRQEVKDLRAKIQSMKKAVPKGDKKRRKEVSAETTRLEQDLQERHERERKSVESNTARSDLCDGEEGGEEEVDGQEKVSNGDRAVARKSRAQKRKEKKALQERERRRLREEEDREMASIINPQLREKENLNALLGSLDLTVVDIQPDGNCLYAAIKDQLWRRLKIDASVAKLRAQCADYVRTHSDDFFPFTTDPKTGDLFTSDQFAQYCSDIENTASWGGQLEIQALSHVYHVTVTIYQAESPPVVVGEEYNHSSSSSLTLSYHRHEYGLGEHYNSLAPISR